MNLTNFFVEDLYDSTAVVLCGGSGKRLWPSSRESCPKQFVNLIDGKSLFELTLDRITFTKKLSIVSNKKYGHFVTQKSINQKTSSRFDFKVLLEPCSKNTCASIALAALMADPDEILVFLPADHIFFDCESFNRAVNSCVSKARDGHLVLIGIVPKSPSDLYGYIVPSGNFNKQPFVSVEEFIEKPTVDKARILIDEKKSYWNAGIFIVKASRIIAEIETHQPEILRLVKMSINKVKSLEEECILADAQFFEQLSNISIDNGVIEKVKDLLMYCYESDWNDLGGWTSVADVVAVPDEFGNQAIGNVVATDSKNTFIKSDISKLVVAYGVDDLAIICDHDVLLVAKKNRLSDMKSLMGTLEKLNKPQVNMSNVTYRPWGSFQVVEEGVGYKVKNITVKPGQSLSLQYHQHRSEHWVVIAGRGRVVLGDKLLEVHANESVYVPKGVHHRLENYTNENLVIIEVQCGNYLGEDDIVRLEDIYGRGGL